MAVYITIFCMFRETSKRGKNSIGDKHWEHLSKRNILKFIFYKCKEKLKYTK